MTRKKKSLVAAGAAGVLAGAVLMLNEPQPPKLPAGLLWEHTGTNTPGFVVERTTNLSTFEQIGFVSVTNAWRTNAEDFTYYFPLTNEPVDMAFYRVGAMLYE